MDQGIDEACQPRVGCAQMAERDDRVECERAVTVEKRELAGCTRAFDR